MVCGDLLFQGSVGRTDFPYSDPAAMRRSLQTVCRLPDPTVVCPGHMGHTTIGEERRTNPFLSASFLGGSG
eukprot:NODE_7881_length_381_cov_160.168675_g6173_i0.p3 GENE.NODE_7881_length_381_cov_160.168675_g6173_i0~~NODE_7881_length_381_cov_160.168675_g6173_i0.p3  ORF type:complete len:71 (-),score=10.28 NODE_7881_length_381_cov_160.168675_g6173_i0:134-346(-)